MKSVTASKLVSVKSWFDKPEKYLSRRQFDIRIRTETVDHFTKHHTFDHVLDIGCGDGSLSLPVLPRSRRITLLDVSASMLDIARSRIPADRLQDVDLFNVNFMDSKLEPESYDLILCVGVLAHVDSPADVITEIERIARPGAVVILEFTDGYHPWGLVDAIYRKTLKMFRPIPLDVNRLKHRDLKSLCRRKGLRPVGLYRYGIPPAGTRWIADQNQMYLMTRFLFGPSNENRNAWMGNEFIYCLEKCPS